eukprot:3690482-Pleurochrysis_carterae.AAC.2
MPMERILINHQPVHLLVQRKDHISSRRPGTSLSRCLNAQPFYDAGELEWAPDLLAIFSEIKAEVEQMRQPTRGDVTVHTSTVQGVICARVEISCCDALFLLALYSSSVLRRT